MEAADKTRLRPPRDLLAPFLAVMLAPAAGLVRPGLRLLEQNRALESPPNAAARNSQYGWFMSMDGSPDQEDLTIRCRRCDLRSRRTRKLKQA